MERPPSRLTKLERELINRADRYPFEQFVFLSSFGSSSKIKSYCKNISASGFLLLEKDLPFALNALVELHIYSINQSKQIKLVGKVVRIDPHESSDFLEYGVQFSFQDHNEMTVWMQFVDTLKV